MSIARHHADWLQLIEVSGPFLTMPVLLKRFKQGLEKPADQSEVLRRLREEYEEWEEAGGRDPAAHRRWVRFVLQEVLSLDDVVLADGQAIPGTLTMSVPSHGETLRPDYIVKPPPGPPGGASATNGKPRLLVQVYPPPQNLDRRVAGRTWPVSPGTRMTELLHHTNVPLGLATNGERWMLVHAPRGETSGFASWYAWLWQQEQLTFRAFRTFLSAERFFGASAEETLEALLAESVSHQQEVTDQLGLQVRRAVEVLIQSLDKADLDHGRQLLGDVSEETLYEAALTVMMRLVFLFCAEERELLLLGDPLYDQHYAVSTLVAQLQETADNHGEEVLERRFDAWSRLLSTFRAVYGGVQHERMKLPAYAGNLFDPDRFPFLEGRRAETSWRDTPASPLPVNNRTVLHLLRSLQFLQTHGEAQRISFRALGIEQIGHVYEGLLDHTAKRATEPILGLIGRKEPEIPLRELVAQRSKEKANFFDYLKSETGSSRKWQNYLDVEIDGARAGRLRAAWGNDSDLFDRVAPFAGLIRDDSFGRPVVIRQGSVFVTAGTDRRTSGTHYTPTSLTEPIVKHTLDPLCYVGPAEGKPEDQWQLRPARELLDLKVCDMACGSGAFLVQACRYLSELLVEAWEQAEAGARDEGRGARNKGTGNERAALSGTGRVAEGDGAGEALLPGTSNLTLAPDPSPLAPRITPYGEPSTGSADEQLIPLDKDERIIYAQRLVAQRCLYGVDKNPLAVEMAKLSLWLLTLAKDKPFTFLDHAIRCGDSLVGISSIEQLLRFSLDEHVSTGPLLEQQRRQIENRLDAVKLLRRQVEEQPSNTPQDIERKAAMLKNADEQTRRLTYAADMLLAENWQPMSAAERESALNSTLVQVEYKFKDLPVRQLDAEAKRRLRQAGVDTRFHWPLEFPEVFERGGFAAFVCNPPFMGGKKITGSLGTPYRDHIVSVLADSAKGNADLCAYFFLRATDLLCIGGNLGFLATNTICQGETREVGFDQIIPKRCAVIQAVASRPWPGTASLEVATVWLHRGTWHGPAVLEGKPIGAISPYLRSVNEVSGRPKVLAANRAKGFQGTIVLGMGFVMTPEEAQALIRANRRNADLLFPFLNGEDITSRYDQSPSRWVINFGDMRLPEAERYTDCMTIVREKVKPERDRLKDKGYREKWWQFGRRAVDLYQAIHGMSRILVMCKVAKHLSMVFVRTGFVYSNRLTVFAFGSAEDFACLQSNLHEVWAREYSATLETRLSYTPTDCFETFPFPAHRATLTDIGEKCHSVRHNIMHDRTEGLTETYNCFHDSEAAAADIQKLRDLHVEMDKAVAVAYGWDDLELGHGFHTTKQGERFTISEAARREVLQRLLKLNHERYAEEVAQGLHEKKTGNRRKSGTRRRTKKAVGADRSLFSENDET